MSKAIDTLIKNIEKKKPGKVKLASKVEPVERITTGSLALDVETGGGWVKGSINECYGKFSSGKSFILYKTIAENQKIHPDAYFAIVLFEDLDKDWVAKCGVDLDRLYIVEPDWMEDGLDIAEELIKSREFFLIGIDSWGAMCPKAEYDAPMEANTMALRARLGNKFIRKIAGVSPNGDNVDLGNTTLIIINQVYDKIGGPVIVSAPPSNKAIEFFGRILVQVKKDFELTLQDKKTGQVIYQGCSFVIDKNKTQPPKNKGHFVFNLKDNPLGKAGDIQLAEELTTYGALSGVIKKGGAWYTVPECFGGVRFQGKDKLVEWLASYPEYHLPLKNLVLESMIRLSAEGIVEENESEEEYEDEEL